MKILLVEDEIKIAAFIKKGLEQAGHAVCLAASAEEAAKQADAHAFDAMVVDIMLPGADGVSFIEHLRRRKKDWVPVLILSARQSVDDRVRGLLAGGDAYLTKPFAFSELLAQLLAITRRKSDAEEQTSLEACGVHVDMLARSVTRAGRAIALQSMEFALLVFLMKNAGSVVSKTTLTERVWNYNFDPQTNVVEVCVFRLREKLTRAGEPKIIHTIRGVGYVFRDEK